MKFEKLSSKAVNTFTNLPQLMFPAGVHKAVLKRIKTADKKSGSTLRTKRGHDKYLLVWEVLDGKGKAYTSVFDNHIDDDSNTYVARKIAHMVEAVQFQPDEDEFFYELADYLQENYMGTVFNVAFKESQDGQSMEVDLFTDEGDPIYELEDSAAASGGGKNTKAKKPTTRKAKAAPTPEPEDEEDEDDFEDEDLQDTLDELDENFDDEEDF